MEKWNGAVPSWVLPIRPGGSKTPSVTSLARSNLPRLCHQKSRRESVGFQGFRTGLIQTVGQQVIGSQVANLTCTVAVHGPESSRPRRVSRAGFSTANRNLPAKKIAIRVSGHGIPFGSLPLQRGRGPGSKLPSLARRLKASYRRQCSPNSRCTVNFSEFPRPLLPCQWHHSAWIRRVCFE